MNTTTVSWYMVSSWPRVDDATVPLGQPEGLLYFCFGAV